MDDFIGILAAGCVVATFTMRSMLSLRLAGIASNIAFIVYGLQLDLLPIWGLHLVLLPINLIRLFEELPRKPWPRLAPYRRRPRARTDWRIEKRADPGKCTPYFVVVRASQGPAQ